MKTTYATNIKRIYQISEASEFMRIEYGYMFNVKVLISVDGGENYYYCGIGKYTKTIEDATAYINDHENK